MNENSMKSKISRAAALLIALFLVFAILSGAAPHFHHLGGGFVYVFGLTGLYFLLPFIIACLLIYVFIGRRPRWLNIRIFLGVALFLLAVAALWSYSARAATAEQISITYDLFDLSYLKGAFGCRTLYGNGNLGGGLIGNLLCDLLLLPIPSNRGSNTYNPAILIVIAIALLLAAIAIIAWPLIRRIAQNIQSHRSINKSRKAEHSEEERLRREEEERLERERLNKPLDENLLPIHTIPKTTEIAEEEPVSRATMVAEPEEPAPAPVGSFGFGSGVPFTPNGPLARSGLQEAVFVPGNGAPAAHQEVAFSPEPIMNPIPAPAPAPAPKPEPAPEPEAILPGPEEEEYIEEEPIVTEPAAFVSPAPAAAPIPEPAPVPEEPKSPFPMAMPRPYYVLPNDSLLKDYPDDGSREEQQRESEERVELINKVFADFRAGAQVANFTIGPSVTRYNIQVDPGVSVDSITRYITNISVVLGGVPTRFVNIVPGQTTSGLEIANRIRRTVSFKEVFDNMPALNGKNNLYIPFGQSISGEYIGADLAEFPHMLVCGATGSGKSVYMHSMILSLIMRNRPEDLKLVMVDPKQVEMTAYTDLPHLLCPIIVDPLAARVCTDKLIEEMESRYTKFRLSGVRNIREFNAMAEEKGYEKMPFIVFIVDEFADLMMSCKDIADRVTRIAAKARAAGIHMVIATQRPTTDVITGTIKANIPARVALSVASAIDSCTIINEKGAEELAGYGDMLVSCQQVIRNGIFRAQGCFVDNKEVANVVSYIKNQIPVKYDPKFLDLADHSKDQPVEAESSGEGVLSPAQRPSPTDPMYEEIKAYTMTLEYTSISRLTRDFGFGFPRAGKVIRMLQEDGIIASQPDVAGSSKGFKVLIRSDNNAENEGSTDNSELHP